MSKLLSRRNCCVTFARCAGALSWWKNTCAAFSGRFSKELVLQNILVGCIWPRCAPWNTMSEDYTIAVPGHGHDNFFSTGAYPKCFWWRWICVLPLSWLIENRNPCLIHCHNRWISIGFTPRKWRKRMITRCSWNENVAILSIKNSSHFPRSH